MVNKLPLFSRKLGLNLFIEFGPIILFFIIFSFFDFIIATFVLVLVVFITFLLAWFIEKRVAVFPLFASGSIIIFGLLTVILNNPTYLIFKDTLFWGLFGFIILFFYSRGDLILKTLFVHIFDITDRGWRIVSIRWIVFSFILAVSNQIALIYFTPRAWVFYKMLTLLALIVFSLWQFVLSKRERNNTANAWGMCV